MSRILSTCPHRAKTHCSDSACTPKWNRTRFWFGHFILLKMEAEHFQERGNKRTEEREVWSWVREKKNTPCFTEDQDFLWKQGRRSSSIIDYHVGRDNLVQPFLTRAQTRQGGPGSFQLNLESVQHQEIQYFSGLSTVQSATSYQMFTLLNMYYLRQPGQISLLFKL